MDWEEQLMSLRWGHAVVGLRQGEKILERRVLDQDSEELFSEPVK
jgi:hypothetical protein